jgi:hypothetical protein
MPRARLVRAAYRGVAVHAADRGDVDSRSDRHLIGVI